MEHKLSFKMPSNACNAAAQIGTVEAYRALADELSLPRAIFVQAKPFARDNTCLLDAIEKFGNENCRGIAVVNNTVSDEELERLHNAGVRGLRFSVWNPNNAVVSFDDCAPLSERVKHLGWNMQLHMGAKQIVQHADVIRALDCKIVIDHMGRLDPVLGINDPAWKFLQEMIDRGNTWIKLSGPYLNTASGHPWEDATKTAEAIAAFAPERVVWGTDFPHVTEKEKPNEWELTELIARWLPTEKARCLALSENPAELYGF